MDVHFTCTMYKSLCISFAVHMVERSLYVSEKGRYIFVSYAKLFGCVFGFGCLGAFGAAALLGEHYIGSVIVSGKYRKGLLTHGSFECLARMRA